jgi:hypothetical protein
MLSEEMSTAKENEAMVSKPAQSTMKPGAYLANPVRDLNHVGFG